MSDRVSAYHDGEMNATDAAAMERHLAECPACAAELTELAGMSRLFAENQPPRLSQIALHRLHNKADDLARADVIRVARVLQAIAASVLVAASIWLMQSSPAVSPLASNSSPSPVAQDQSQVPPWLDVAVTATAQTTQLDTTTPAAAWYLADLSSRSDD